jgi:hypothetical protein
LSISTCTHTTPVHTRTQTDASPAYLSLPAKHLTQLKTAIVRIIMCTEQEQSENLELVLVRLESIHSLHGVFGATTTTGRYRCKHMLRRVIRLHDGIVLGGWERGVVFLGTLHVVNLGLRRLNLRVEVGHQTQRLGQPLFSLDQRVHGRELLARSGALACTHVATPAVQSQAREDSRECRRTGSARHS